MKLRADFFNRKTLTVAKQLLGKFIVRKIGRQKLVGQIVETEAYCGPNDLASHASRGKTPRTALMFGPAGRAYIYLIYGMYYCFNIVTEKNHYPAAVLIRAVKPIAGIKQMEKNRNWKLEIRNSELVNGPSKFCQAFQIDKKLNGLDLTGNDKIWLEDRGVKIQTKQIKSAKRIGVDYAKEYKDKLWRFYLDKI